MFTPGTVYEPLFDGTTRIRTHTADGKVVEEIVSDREAVARIEARIQQQTGLAISPTSSNLSRLS